MRFTRHEFWRGARAAWITFMIVLAVFLTISAIRDSGPPGGPPLSTISLYLMFGMPIGGVVSAAIGLLSAPFAWMLGRALSRTRNIAAHICAYVAFGAVLGVAVVVIWGAIGGADLFGLFASGIPLLIAAVCGVSVALGWAYTVWRSTRPRGRCVEVDAHVEDTV